jgi:hypothetical protein
MSDAEVTPAERDPISRKRIGDRIASRLDNCFRIGEDPIIDLINGEQRHLYTAVTFDGFDNFIDQMSDFRICQPLFESMTL